MGTMTMQMRSVAAAMLVAGLTTGAAVAQRAASPQTRQYVEATAQSDTFEIMEAYSALAESRDPQVIAFARQMIADHERTAQTLRDAAASVGLVPPDGVGAARSPLLAALQSQHGAMLDKVYWHQQALAHQSALIVQQHYAEDGDTPALRKAATDSIPMIRSHLDTAMRMSTAVGEP